MKKYLPLLNIIVFVLTIAVNYTASAGLLSNDTVGSISGKYENLFTPAGWAFSIWGLIYLGLAGFLFLQAGGTGSKADTQTSIDRTGIWFIVSCITNMLWIFVWVNDQPGLSLLVIVALLISLLIIMERIKDGSKQYNFLVWWPFTLYAGWVTVATIANAAAWLTSIEWTGWGVTEVKWTVTMIVAAALINIIVIWRKYALAFGIAGAWALAAIAFSSGEKSATVSYVAAVASGALVINILVKGFQGK